MGAVALEQCTWQGTKSGSEFGGIPIGIPIQAEFFGINFFREIPNRNFRSEFPIRNSGSEFRFGISTQNSALIW